MRPPATFLQTFGLPHVVKYKTSARQVHTSTRHAHIGVGGSHVRACDLQVSARRLHAISGVLHMRPYEVLTSDGGGQMSGGGVQASDGVWVASGRLMS